MRISDVDLTSRRIHVTRRVTEAAGRLDVSRPKSKASDRYIAIPATIGELLKARVTDRSPNDLVFPSPEGSYLRNTNWRRRSGFDAATESVGLRGVTPHDLRRTFGSLARSAGADLRYIQKAMGHESVTTTARIYAHLYDTELDQVSDALDRLTARDLTTEHGQKVASSRGGGTTSGAVRDSAMGDAELEVGGNKAADLRKRQAPAQRDID